jgi:hypothetical protein
MQVAGVLMDFGLVSINLLGIISEKYRLGS